MNVQTIDINAKEWFDKINGNSYFSANVTVNFGQPDQLDIYLPFQYGYGSHYVDMACKELQKKNLITLPDSYTPLWRYCKDHGIVLRTSKQENCKKRDL